MEMEKIDNYQINGEYKTIINYISEKNLFLKCPNENCYLIPFFYSYENNIISMKCNNKHFYNISIIEYYKILIDQIKFRKSLNNNKIDIKLVDANTICENCKKNNGGFCIHCQRDYCEECLEKHLIQNNHLTIYYYQRYPDNKYITKFDKYVENELKNIFLIENILNKVQNEQKYKAIIDNLEEVKLILKFFQNIIYTFNTIKMNMAILENLMIILSLSRYSFYELIQFIEHNKNSNDLCNKIYSIFLENLNSNKLNNHKKTSIKLIYKSSFSINNEIYENEKNLTIKNNFPLFDSDDNDEIDEGGDLADFDDYPLNLNDHNLKNVKNNSSFLYLLKSGNILLANNKLFEIDIIDKKALKVLLKIKIEDIINDLCEGKNDILFVLTKNIQIIKINDNNYSFLNKIELNNGLKISFIYTLSNKEIISPSDENKFIYIWEDKNFFDINDKNNISNNNIINHKIEMKNKIISLLKWDEKYFICEESNLSDFKSIKIYSLIYSFTEQYILIDNGHIKIKNCSNDKNTLIKINKEILGVCNKNGISLVSFKYKEVIAYLEFNIPILYNIFSNNDNYLILGFKNNEFKLKNDFLRIIDIKNMEYIDFYYNPIIKQFINFENNIKNYENKLNGLINFLKEKDINQIMNEKSFKSKRGNIMNAIFRDIFPMIIIESKTIAFIDNSNSIHFYSID